MSSDLAATVRATVPGFHRSDRDLLVWAIARAGADSRRVVPRWVHVRDLFGVGSTVAWALCGLADVNPDDVIGGA